MSTIEAFIMVSPEMKFLNLEISKILETINNGLETVVYMYGQMEIKCIYGCYE